MKIKMCFYHEITGIFTKFAKIIYFQISYLK